METHHSAASSIQIQEELMSGTITTSRKRRRSVLQPPSENDAPPEATWPLSSEDLPEDLIAEILSRLPVKSLVRFRCVCKSWKSLILSSNFVNNHLHRSSTDPNLRHHRLLVCEWLGNGLRLSRSLGSVMDNPSSSPPVFDDLTFDMSPNGLIVGSCNGLVCWVDPHRVGPHYRNDHYVFYLNPSTRLKSKSPRLRQPWHIDSSFTVFGFGYDNLSDRYKTVAIYYDPNTENIDIKVYALGGARSWRKMQTFPFVPRISRRRRDLHGIFVSGTLNWLATRPDGSPVVVSVDLGKETCGEVLLPHVDRYEEVGQRPKLFVLRGCLCFSYDFNGIQFVVWQMKLYGATGSWAILFNISYLDLGIRHYFRFHPRPLFMSDNGELLLKIDDCGLFVLYNPRHNSFKYLHVRSDGISLEGTTHIDSLVSPCLTRS